MLAKKTDLTLKRGIFKCTGNTFYHLKTLVPAVAVVCGYLVLMNATSSVQDGQSCVGIYYTCV